MSYNPCRGNGIMFEKACNNAEKYRVLFFEQSNVNTFESLKKASKSLYFWMLNENKISNIGMDVNMFAHITTINVFKRNIHLVYKPLLQYL